MHSTTSPYRVDRIIANHKCFKGVLKHNFIAAMHAFHSQSGPALSAGIGSDSTPLRVPLLTESVWFVPSVGWPYVCCQLLNRFRCSPYCLYGRLQFVGCAFTLLGLLGLSCQRTRPSPAVSRSTDFCFCDNSACMRAALENICRIITKMR